MIRKDGDYFEQMETWAVPPKLIYRPKVANEGRERVITRDERERLINHLLRKREDGNARLTTRRRAGLMLYCGLPTGLRHGEPCGLEKANYDARARRLKAERFKTKKSGVRWTVFEPLTDTQAQILSEAAELCPDGDYFFSEHGKRHNKIYTTLAAACVKLGIEYGSEYGAKKANGFVRRDSRHTFVTALEHGAVDTSTTRSFTAHTRDWMLKRYAHATPESRARAMEIIEKEMTLNGGERGLSLKRIFEAVRAGETGFDQFREALRSSAVFFLH